MYDIQVKNMKVYKGNEPYDLKVDRSSVLGNKFFMNNESERDRVCEKYAEWLETKIISKDENIMNELYKLYDTYQMYNQLNLLCWCSPKRCHADYIKKVIIRALECVDGGKI